jgi:predicted Zn-dependent protease with MMP-like domain
MANVPGRFNMDRSQFEDLVVSVVDGLPEEFQELLDNVDIIVEEWPTREQLRQVGLRNKEDLLGLYEGMPMTERGQNYNLVLPDKITIFRKPLEAQCTSLADLKHEIADTVKHEIAHYFGIGDERLDEIEDGRR